LEENFKSVHRKDNPAEKSLEEKGSRQSSDQDLSGKKKKYDAPTGDPRDVLTELWEKKKISEQKDRQKLVLEKGAQAAPGKKKRRD